MSSVFTALSYRKGIKLFLCGIRGIEHVGRWYSETFQLVGNE